MVQRLISSAFLHALRDSRSQSLTGVSLRCHDKGVAEAVKLFYVQHRNGFLGTSPPASSISGSASHVSSTLLVLKEDGFCRREASGTFLRLNSYWTLTTEGKYCGGHAAQIVYSAFTSSLEQPKPGHWTAPIFQKGHSPAGSHGKIRRDPANMKAAVEAIPCTLQSCPLNPGKHLK